LGARLELSGSRRGRSLWKGRGEAACDIASPDEKNSALRTAAWSSSSPARPRPSLARIDLAKITRDLHRSYPEAHFTCRDIPFPELNECLADKTVDVLWTNVALPDAAVDSRPLNVDTELGGVGGVRHRWADAGSVDVGAFCDEPMLFNPAVSEQWMRPFW